MVNGKQERLAKKRLLLSGTCDYSLCTIGLIIPIIASVHGGIFGILIIDVTIWVMSL